MTAWIIEVPDINVNACMILDELIQRREAGTLAQFVKERADGACKK